MGGQLTKMELMMFQLFHEVEQNNFCVVLFTQDIIYI